MFVLSKPQYKMSKQIYLKKNSPSGTFELSYVLIIATLPKKNAGFSSLHMDAAAATKKN